MLLRALLLLGATAIACLPAWLRGDWVGTEGRRVQIALEMLHSGDWLVPTLGGEPTWAKPPLHYWLLAGCAWLFGDGHMVLRLPSVLGAFAGAFAAGELLRRWYGSAAGWLAALGILCAPVVVFTWPTAEIDPLFATLTALSLWCLGVGVARDRRALVLASGACAGLAVLQKGPPFLLFAVGAYLVWWRHRRLRHGLWHFVPLLALPLAYFVPLWLWRIDPGEMLAIANDESVGRIATFEWRHVYETPLFWLRAVLVVMPFVLWCFWEWRGARDARMNAVDLPLRMCSGSAVLAVALLTFFPARPTRYMLPNVLLFTFAVAPAVAHFYRHRGPMPRTVQWVVRALGCLGAAALVLGPFVPRVGIAAFGFALVVALLPRFVATPRAVVLASLAVPLVAAWTVGLERTLDWPLNGRARASAGRLLRQELDARGATQDLATRGHFDSGLLLAAGVLPRGDEQKRTIPSTRWLLREVDWQPFESVDHVERLRLILTDRTFVLLERTQAPR